MNRGSCDRCEEQEGTIAEGTELWCSTCYVILNYDKLKNEGDIDGQYI